MKNFVRLTVLIAMFVTVLIVALTVGVFGTVLTFLAFFFHEPLTPMLLVKHAALFASGVLFVAVALAVCVQAIPALLKRMAT